MRSMPNPEAITQAARLLRELALVAFPTETVYGLGADARSDKAVLKIFQAKGRPRFNPLIVHIGSLAAAKRLGRFDIRAGALAQAFWPGPLTLVVPMRTDAGLSDLVTAGLDTVALRVPGHKTAQRLLSEADMPVAAPSANVSGTVSPTRADHVAGAFGNQIAMILDAGPTDCGLESTIVSVAPGEPLRCLRPGSVTRAELAATTGETVADAEPGKISSPGQLRRHYAPAVALRLNAATAGPGEALIAFGPPPPGHKPFVNLSPAGDLGEAAAGLFAALRALDDAGIARAAVMPIPDAGLGEAINDRLSRASAPMDAT
ncbi:Threonylcarbamoyl-AMP synthase / SUA5 domain with internal deletion [hydrothermal vent metagenome]|uniref:Threonylcarbamoyl-AMP synthase n=1 Tax=hydrothermal vent metagenome TaxID=652676 RepID=A0A3B0T0I2_9ZZZZ